jgi:hypothetical protein
VLRNVGIYNSDAGELPKRKHNIFLPILFAALGALGGLDGGAAAITNAVKTAQHQSAEEEEEVKRHNKEMEIIIIILFIYCNLECWEPSQHLLLDTGKPRKTCVEVASRRTFRILTSSQLSGICLARRNAGVVL